MEWTPIKNQHTKLTLEKNILPPLLPGFELTIFRPRVRRSSQKAIPAPIHIFDINGKIHFLPFQCCYVLLNLLRRKRPLTRRLYIHFHSKRPRVCRKNLLNKDIVQMTSTSVKGRHSIDAQINAKSFEYCYFPQTETVFVVQFSKIGREDISVPY